MKHVCVVVTSLALMAACTAPEVQNKPPPPPKLPTDVQCKADVSRQLGAYLSSRPPGATVSLPPLACYRVDGEVTVRSRNLTVEGNGARLVRESTPSDRSTSLLRIERSELVTVRNLVLAGDNAKGGVDKEEAYQEERSGQHGIAVEASKGTRIDRVEVSHVYGDAIYLRSQAADTHITEANLHDAGRQGIGVVGAARTVVERSIIRNAPRSVVDLEVSDSKQFIDGFTLQDSSLGLSGFNRVVNQGGRNAARVTIAGNRTVDGAEFLVSNEGEVKAHLRQEDWRIERNVGAGTTDRPVVNLVNVDGLVVRDNTQQTTASEPVRCKGCSTLVVEGNRF